LSKMPIDDIEWANGLKKPPRPDELKRFHELISKRTRMQPVYLVLEKPYAIRSIRTDKDGKEFAEAVVHGKDPISSESGGWVEVGIDEAIEYMTKGHNIGIVAAEGSGLVLVDIDIPELVEDVKEDTLTIASRKRIGRHYYYIDMDPDDANLKAATNCGVDTDDNIEIISIRAKNQYCVAPGSFVPFSREEYEAVPDHDKENTGYYTVSNERKPADITFAELPGVVRTKLEDAHTRRDQKPTPRAFNREFDGKGKKSGIFEITPEDLFGNPGSNFSHPVHGSTTGMNCTISNGLLHCWRHGTYGDGYACLAMLTGVISCEDMYAHGSKTTALKRDGEEYFKVWSEAKKKRLIPFDDKPPTEARKYYAVMKGIMKQEEVDTLKGGKFTKEQFKAIMRALETDGLMPPHNGQIKSGGTTTTDCRAIDNDGVNGTETTETNMDGLTIGEIFGGKYDGIEIGNGYKIDRKGLFVTKIVGKGDKEKTIKAYISGTPFFVSAMGKNIDTDDVHIRVTFLSRSNLIRELIIPLHDAMRKNTVTVLIGRGILFTDNEAGYVTSYLKSCIESNQELPQITKVDKNGWKKDQHGVPFFVCGKKAYTAHEEIDVIPSHEQQFDGLGPHGEVGDWTEGINEALRDFTLLRFKTYTALSAALLRPLRVQSFLQDHYGETGAGKSCSSDLALSVWGNSDKLRFNGDTTQTAAEHIAATMCDLPIYLDETGTQLKKEVLTAIVYMVANEIGRMRGKKDGGLRDIQTWKTVAMTTGEKPIVNESGFTGQQVRVMQLTDRLTPDGLLSPVVTKALSAIKKSHGHIGPLFVQEYMKEPDCYIELMKETEKKYSRDGSVTVTENRMLRQFAVIYVAGVIAERIFARLGMQPANPEVIVGQFMKEIVARNRIEVYAIRGLRAILDYRTTQTRNFVDVEARDSHLAEMERQKMEEFKENYDSSKVNLPPYQYEIFGFWRKSINCIDFVPNTLKMHLEGKLGLDSKRLLTEWAEMGVLVTDNDGGQRRYTKKVTKKNDVTVSSVYRISVQKAEEVLKRASGEEEIWQDNR